MLLILSGINFHLNFKKRAIYFHGEEIVEIQGCLGKKMSDMFRCLSKYNIFVMKISFYRTYVYQIQLHAHLINVFYDSNKSYELNI